MTLHATGAFEVKTTPLRPNDATGGADIGRYALDKQFHGDLVAAGKGEMLWGRRPRQGQCRLRGNRARRRNSPRPQRLLRPLQHTGTMNQGKFQLIVTVVPGSGAGGLAGIAGTMTITITNGKHSYDFECTLPEGSE